MEDINTTQKNTEALSVAHKEVGITVTDEKMNCKQMTRKQNEGQTHNIKRSQ
jgi:hypothetical protein